MRRVGFRRVILFRAYRKTKESLEPRQVIDKNCMINVLDLPSSQTSLSRCENGGRAREEGEGTGRETSGRECFQDDGMFNGG